MDVSMLTAPEQAALDQAVNALQTAVLLVTRLDTDHDALRRALTRAVQQLAIFKPKESR